MSFSFDEDQLIAEIQSRPVLWDASNEFYRNKFKARDAWLDVARNVIPNFESLTPAKHIPFGWTYYTKFTYDAIENLTRDSSYNYHVEQMKTKYYKIRQINFAAMKDGQPMPQAEQLAFLHSLWSKKISKITRKRGNSAEVAETNVEEAQSTHSNESKKEAPLSVNNHNFLANSLKPVLSIEKLNPAQVNGIISRKRGPGRPSAKRKSLEENVVKSPKMSKSVVLSDTVDEPNEEGGNVKNCQYRYEVQTASTHERVPTKPTSTCALLSYEDDRHSTERKIVPHNDLLNDRAHNYDSYSERAHNYDLYDDRSYNDVRIDRPERERGHSPTSSPMRRHESYYDSRHYDSHHYPMRFPMIPFPSVPLDYHDDDMAFFRSLLRWTKRFSEEEKLEFRSEVMRLISRMRNRESADNYYVLSHTPIS